MHGARRHYNYVFENASIITLEILDPVTCKEFLLCVVSVFCVSLAVRWVVRNPLWGIVYLPPECAFVPR